MTRLVEEGKVRAIGVSNFDVGSPEQVDGWIAAARLKLTDRDLEEISEAIERTGAGSGPVSAKTAIPG